MIKTGVFFFFNSNFLAFAESVTLKIMVNGSSNYLGFYQPHQLVDARSF